MTGHLHRSQPNTGEATVRRNYAMFYRLLPDTTRHYRITY